MGKKIEAILFDMDGVLVDTEQLHCKSYIIALKKYGIELIEEEYFTEWTRKGKGITDYIKERNLSLNTEEIRAVKRALYHQMLKEKLRTLPGIRSLLKKAKGEYMIALVSSSYRIDVELILELTKLRKYFDVVISKDEVSRIKPDPEPFLLAAKKLGVEPYGCLVIEDAEKGVIAAKAAGMRCVAMPSVCTRDNDFSKADYIVKDIKGVSRIIYLF